MHESSESVIMKAAAAQRALCKSVCRERQQPVEHPQSPAAVIALNVDFRNGSWTQAVEVAP